MQIQDHAESLGTWLGMIEIGPDALLASRIPAVLGEVSAAGIPELSPHIIPFDTLRSTMGATPARRAMIDELSCLISKGRTSGIDIVYGLVGGSFLAETVSNPRDLDCVLFYKTQEYNAGTEAFLGKRKFESLDVRFAPIDGSPMVMLKIALSMQTLYLCRRPGQPQRGTILFYT